MYTLRSTPPRVTSYTKNTGNMLLCRVALGKVSEHQSAAQFSHAPPGHHSVKGVPSPNGLKYPEYIIYRGEQVQIHVSGSMVIVIQAS